jgi:LacI family transcriptional regulator
MSHAAYLRYQAVHAQLADRLRRGLYPVGSRLPSEAALAAELGVSRPTVKRALRDLTAEGLLQTRPAVGTFVCRGAAAPALLGYVCPTLADPFQGELLRCLEAAIQAHHLGLLVAESGPEFAGEAAALHHLAKLGAWGAIICGGPASPPLPAPAAPMPIVYCAGIPRQAQADRVTVDHGAGVRALLHHLAAGGARTVGYAGAATPAQPLAADPRYAAFLAELPGSALLSRPAWQIGLPGQGEALGEALLDHFLASPPLPDAILACDDWTAIGLLRQAANRGLQVPRQLRVTGFDNLLVSRYLPVPLTTIDYPLPALLRAALELLQQRLAQPAAPTVLRLLPGALVVRASA